MSTRETVYEAIVALRADSAQLRSDLTSGSSVLKSGLAGMSSLASTLMPVLSIGGVVAFGKSLLDATDQLTNLAAQTGFSAQTLSGLKSTLEENGTSLDAFARGIFVAQKNMGGIDEESDKAAVAIGRLGLNVDQLQSASPEEFLKLVGTAMAGISNPTERAALGATIFGKAWKELAPVLGEVAMRLDELRASGMTDADIKKFDDFGDALTRMGNKAKIITVGVLSDLFDGLERFFNVSQHAQLTNELVAIGNEMDKLQVIQHKTNAQLEREDELRARLLRISQIKALAAGQPKEKGDGESGLSLTAKAEAEALKHVGKAMADLGAVTREVDQATMTPLGKTIDDLYAKILGISDVNAKAFKGKELDAYNLKLDAQLDKLVAIATKSAGKAEVSKFESSFDVKLPFTNKAAGADLAQNFIGVFNQFKNDPGAQAAMQQAFASLVKQGIAAGVPDLPEMLATMGLSNTEIDRFSAALAPDLKAGFAASIQAGEQWGAAFKRETDAMQANFAEIGKPLALLQADIDSLRDAATQNMTMAMDTSNAEAGVARLSLQLDLMRQQIQTMPKVQVTQ